MSRCRDCHRTVRWASAVTSSGSYRKKFDADPSPDGEWVLDYRPAFYDRDDRVTPERWTARWVASEFRAGAELHVSHDEVCKPIAIRGAA